MKTNTQHKDVLVAEIPAEPIQDSFTTTSTTRISDRLKFKYTPSAFEKVYKKSPFQFAEDKKRVAAIFDKISENNRLSACKLKSVTNDKSFHIKLGIGKDLPQEDTLGVFDPADNSITLRTNVHDSPEQLETTIHESHHAFVARENKKANRHIYKGIAQAFPHFSLAKAENKFKPLLKLGFGRVKSALSLLEKIAKNKKLSSEEHQHILKLQAAAKKYEMPIRPGPLVKPEDEEFFIQDGVIDKNGKVINRIAILPDPVAPLYLQGIEKRDDGKKIYRLSILPNISTGFDKLKAILLSYYRLIEIDIPAQNYPSDILKETETDAFTHQMFQSHDVLFEMLFPELLEYHQNKRDAEFRSCLRTP